jgi:hypothetical protein
MRKLWDSSEIQEAAVLFKDLLNSQTYTPAPENRYPPTHIAVTCWKKPLFLYAGGGISPDRY